MVQNHLFQLLTLVAMEPPTCFAADAVRAEKLKVLDAVHDSALRMPAATWRGASTGPARSMAGTWSHTGVPPTSRRDSVTETYIALKLMIDNWRWAGVPFYIRTGKALATRCTGVVIQFKQAPFALFRDTPVSGLRQ